MSEPNHPARARCRSSAWRLVAGLGLLACVLEAAALSSGAPRGTPLIGRTLQLTIPVSWERGEQPPCVRAEFLQGESPGGPLRWRLDQVGEGSGLLRLFSTLPVQEPAITVQVALGCGQQFSREYVLLAEPPNEAREAQVAAETPELPVALAPLPLASATTLSSLSRSEAAAPAAAPAPAAGPQRSARSERAARTRTRTAAADADAPRREPSGRAPPARPELPSARATPRLKLEPIDIAIDEAPVLRLTSTLAALPNAAPAGHAAALGVAPAAATTPEQQAAQAAAAKAVETELRAMRELVQRYGAETRAVTQRLEKVSSERDLVVNVLAGLVVLLGAGMGWLLWQRSRESAARRAWWDQGQGAPYVPPQDSEAAVAAELAAVSAGAATARAAAPPVPDPGEPVEQPVPFESTSAFDLFELPDFDDLDQTRMPTVEELLELREKIAFFNAAEQPERAVLLLESRLKQQTGGSPFIWLELLSLCRRLGMRDEHERVRKGFQKQFSVRFPRLTEPEPPSEGLEAHPAVLARISEVWRLPRVLQVIEDALFLDPTPRSVAFDLEASRELLMLHALATQVQAQPVTAGVEEPFPATMHAPLMELPDVAPRMPAPAPEPEPEPEPQPAPAAAPRQLEVLQWEESAHLALPTLPTLETRPAPEAPRTDQAPSPDIDLESMQSLLPDDLDFDTTPRRQRAGS